MSIPNEKILLVDDDPNLLAGLRRQFRGTYRVVTAEGGKQGLVALQEQGPFAVLISDMRMPEMNGIQFLMKAKEVSPDTVRMMLTGNADIDTAMHAVNEGNIFRFLTKPCQRETMEWAIESALKQYRMVVAERQLLEGTLKGSIQVIADVLALVNPSAFSRTARIRQYVTQIVHILELPDTWQYEVAALLSQLGCIAVPPEVLAKATAGQELDEKENQLFQQHPVLGGRLLARIPRLETVAEMITQQMTACPEESETPDALPEEPGKVGALILRAVIDFDTYIARGITSTQAIGYLRKANSQYHPRVLDAMQRLEAVDIVYNLQA
ncbi:MAG: response regulator, partial [Candidatus Zixiibacteriota bacterium]